jgi:hypothetical protein
MVRIMLAVPAVLGIALISACGASTSPTTSPPTATRAPAIAAPTPPPASTSAPAGPLSGTWTGQYSGPFTGTFTLNWTESGSALTGTLQISNPPGSHNITGSATDTAITFGYVGGVTYSGTVSGNTMSGSYQVPAGRGTGSWNATKS